MTSNAMSPNHREILSAQSTITGKMEYVKSTAGALNTTGGGGGGGTQYTEGVTTAPASGTVALGRYNVTPPSLTDGQLYAPQLDSAGNLKVTGSLSIGGTTDNSAYTAGSSTGTPSMGFYHSTIDTVTDGRSATIAITSKRAMMVNLQNATGTEIGTLAAPLRVDTTGSTVQPISVATLPLPSGAATAAKQPALGTAGTPSADVITVQGTASGTALKVDGSAVTQPVSIVTVPSHAVTNAGTFAVQDSQVIADNAGFTDGTSKVFPAGYIYDEVAGTALTENDAAAARINVNRAVVNVIEDGATRGRYSTVTASNALKVDGSAVTQPVSLATNTPTLAAGTAIVGKVGIDQTTPGTTNAVSISQIGATTVSTGNGVVGAGVQRVAIASDNSAIASIPTPSATVTSLSLFRSTALTNTATAVKGSSGRIYKIHLFNPNTADAYVQLYDLATGSTTVGTSTPTWTWWVSGGGAIDDSLTIPIGGATALTVAATTTITGGTAPSTGLLVEFGYI
jgi:hypothetical protein